MGRFNEAISDYSRALEIEPDRSADWKNQLGVLSINLGRYDEALEYFIQVLEVEPENPTSLYNLIVVKAHWEGAFNALVDTNETKVALKNILDTPKRAFGFYGLGGLEALEGNIEEALYYLRESIALNKDAAKWARHDIAWSELSSNIEFNSIISC